MPRNTREANKRKLQGIITRLETIDTDIGSVYITFPQDEKYKKYTESLVNAGMILNNLKDLISLIEENI